VDNRSNNIYIDDGDSIYRICIAMGTNELLGSNSNNKLVVSDTMDRERIGGIDMRGF